MRKRASAWGKLSLEQLQDFDGLLLKMKEKNRLLLEKEKIQLEEIRPLADDENNRLWSYITHYASLQCKWPNIRRAISYFAALDDSLSREDIEHDAMMYIAIHVYRYAWRKYTHSDECAYVFSTGTLGWKEWQERMNKRSIIYETKKNAHNVVQRHRGHKVNNVNMSD